VDIAPNFDRRRGFRSMSWNRFASGVCLSSLLMLAIPASTELGGGRPSKLDSAECMLSFVLFVKHNTSIRYESSSLNWSRSSACEDVLFIASVINCALSDEISLTSPARRAHLGQVLPEFPGCIGHIDGTLSTINRPSVPEHGQNYNRRKNM
jgi:hypothetical protein